MSNLLIKGGTIVTPKRQFKGDIKVEDGMIKSITDYSNLPDKKSNFDISSGFEVIDATGLHIFPGMIDDQVHFREPGAIAKATIYSESRAAVLGGVTSFMDMPNNNPPATSNDAIEHKLKIAEKDSYANYSFYLGATNDNLNEILAVDKKRICGVKVFMGSSTGNMLVDNDIALEEIFAKSPVLVATHCEDEATIKANLQYYKELYTGKEIPFSAHPLIRSREACIKSTSKAIELAKRFGTRLHILHISTAEEIKMITDTISDGYKNITGEICVHYLYFNSKDYEKMGSKIKCNPAIKDEPDMLALREAVKDGIIKVVATDHAPHLLMEKEHDYLNTPSGLPLVQHSFQLMMELVKQGIFKIEDIPAVMSLGPAENFGISKRGAIKEGYFADLLIADINLPDKTSTKYPAYKCGWSPFADINFSTSIKYTIVNGVVAAKDGKITGCCNAMPLEFNRI